MTADAFTEQARGEAEERPTIALARFIAAWDQGVETTDRISHWAANLASALRDHLAAQEPTDAAVRAAMRVLYESDGPRDEAVIRSAIREAMKEQNR